MSEYHPDYHPEEEQKIERWVLFCGGLAPFFSILLFLSPIPTIRRVLVTGTVGDLPLLPYTSMAASTFVWVVYGILKKEPLIWGTNSVEFVLSVYYFVEFTNYCSHKEYNVYKHIKGCAGIAVATLLMALLGKASWIGDATVVLSIVMFASPLAALEAVVRSQSAAAIPWPFTIATLMNCALWTIVGVWELHDVYVYFPEVLGLLLGCTQVVLKIKYGDGDDSNPTFHLGAPVEMPVPILGSLRQVVLLGNTDSNNMQGDSSNENRNNPQSLLGSYMPINPSE